MHILLYPLPNIDNDLFNLELACKLIWILPSALTSPVNHALDSKLLLCKGGFQI